jgi:hypothetical protein
MMVEHRVVYRESGKFGGWPANYGMWAWGDELVVGFTCCTHQAKAGFHARSHDLPAVPFQARSRDGGQTWVAMPIPALSPGGRGFSADEHMQADLSVARAIELGLAVLPAPCVESVDFTHPDFAMMCARTGLGKGTTAWFYITYDRANSWQGPFSLPGFGLAGTEARTDTLVNGSGDCMLFLTAAREDGGEGRGVYLARTRDGGLNFNLDAWVTEVDEYHTIMPSSVRINERTLLTAVRCFGAKGDFEVVPTWIDLFESQDNGASFHALGRPVTYAGSGGNPPTLLRLQDGRVCLVYGYRAAPFGIRARLSEDGGRSWGEEIHLRDDGGCADLGYPRSIQRPDGVIVTTYYFNDQADTERYIAATLWMP